MSPKVDLHQFTPEFVEKWHQYPKAVIATNLVPSPDEVRNFHLVLGASVNTQVAPELVDL